VSLSRHFAAAAAAGAAGGGGLVIPLSVTVSAVSNFDEFYSCRCNMAGLTKITA